eukprot:SAG11_NODE_5183_length_1637_cov_2.002601_2_plen_259_part_00
MESLPAVNSEAAASHKKQKIHARWRQLSAELLVESGIGGGGNGGGGDAPSAREQELEAKVREAESQAQEKVEAFKVKAKAIVTKVKEEHRGLAAHAGNLEAENAELQRRLREVGGGGASGGGLELELARLRTRCEELEAQLGGVLACCVGCCFSQSDCRHDVCSHCTAAPERDADELANRKHGELAQHAAQLEARCAEQTARCEKLERKLTAIRRLQVCRDRPSELLWRPCLPLKQCSILRAAVAAAAAWWRRGTAWQ